MSDVVATTPPVAQILDVVYRVDQGSDEWLRSLRTTIGGERHSVAGLARQGAGPAELVTLSADPVAAQVMHEVCTAPVDGRVFMPMAMPGTLSGTQSENLGPLPSIFVTAYGRSGSADAWGVMGLSPCGAGLCYSHLLPRRARSTVRARRYWDAVAIHFAAAARLRLALTSASEALLAPDGKVLHAEGRARHPDHRESLRRAARAIDRARAGKGDPLAAIESWTALVEGRWSLVDQFESDGRRFVVARVNDPEVGGNPALSSRERQVVALAALGRSNKQIAYELGLNLASVASYLRRAARKLGADSRSALIVRAARG